MVFKTFTQHFFMTEIFNNPEQKELSQTEKEQQGTPNVNGGRLKIVPQRLGTR